MSAEERDVHIKILTSALLQHCLELISGICGLQRQKYWTRWTSCIQRRGYSTMSGEGRGRWIDQMSL